MMRERSSPLSHLRRLIDDWPEISDDLIALPRIMHSLVRERERERTRPRRNRQRHLQQQAKAARRIFVGAVFLLAGVLWLGLDVAPVAVGWLAAVLGSGALLYGAFRS